jgi:hypothetical protein
MSDGAASPLETIESASGIVGEELLAMGEHEATKRVGQVTGGEVAVKERLDELVEGFVVVLVKEALECRVAL